MIDDNTKSLLIKAIEKNGDTVYVYDFEKIKCTVKYITSIFNNGFQVLYAVKANSNISILKLIDELGLGFDACSTEELFLLHSQKISMTNVFYNSDCLTLEELNYAKNIGANIIIGSIDSLEDYCINFQNSSIGLRINTGFGAGHSQSVITGGELSKFGIPESCINEACEICKKYNVTIVGIHAHTGSGINNHLDYLENAQRLAKISLSFNSLNYINYGGGFPIDYTRNTKEDKEYNKFNLLELSLALKEINKTLIIKHKNIKTLIEPGRYCVAESGFLVTRVNSVKKTDSICFVGLNTGYNHFPRCFIYNAFHEIENISSTSDKKYLYDIVGYLCQAGDIFARNRVLSETKKGDIICINDVGAYGYALSSSFNSRLKPAEIAIINNSLITIRKKEAIESLLNGQTT